MVDLTLPLRDPQTREVVDPDKIHKGDEKKPESAIKKHNRKHRKHKTKVEHLVSPPPKKFFQVFSWQVAGF